MNKQDRLQKTLINICHHGSGTVWERYENCKDILKSAYQEGVIEYYEYGDWLKMVIAVLEI